MDPAGAAPRLSTRLADWRFLLPAATGDMFDHLLLLGGPANLAEHLVECGVAGRVSTTTQACASADAVIVLADAKEPLDAAVRTLRPEGVLYWEVDRRTPRRIGLTTRRAMARLQSLGVQPSAAYWVKPGFPRREMYLPMGSRGPFRWYLDTLYRSPTGGRRALKAGLRAVASDERRLAMVAPCYAVVGRSGAAPQPAALVQAASRVLGSPNELEAVFLTHGERECNRIGILLFAPRATAPLAVLKIARHAVLNGHVEREHQHLQEIRSTVDPVLQRSLPSSVLFRWNDLAVAIETCVPGATLNSRTGSPAPEALQDLHVASEWLTRFHRATTEAVPARAWMTRRLAGELCPEYAAAFGLTGEERHLFQLAARRLDALAPLQLPIVWQHADFGPWNVYRDRMQVSVIDWEGARRGPALSDLLYFAMHWSMQVSEAGTPNGRLKQFEALFCSNAPSTPLNRAILAEVAAYAQQMHLADAMIPLLLLYTVLEQALDFARRLASFGPAAAGSRVDNPYTGYVGVLARHADRLLGSEAYRAA